MFDKRTEGAGLVLRIAAAGLSGAVAGPLGVAIGGWPGDGLGSSANAIIKEAAKNFGEKSAEKLLDIGSDSLAEKLKSPSLHLERLCREALRLSLMQIGSQRRLDGFDDWFGNWNRCLSASQSLNLSSINQDYFTLQKVDDIFGRAMESLDAQGAAILRDDISLSLKTRTIPEALLSELTAFLPGLLSKNFKDLIVPTAI